MADMSSLEDALRERGREIRDGALLLVERAVSDDAPVGQTANLKNSIRATPTESGDSVGVLISAGEGLDPAYAEMVDKGTAPHEIRPRSAKALRFEVAGVVVFAKVVQHPGTKADPFFTSNVERWDEFLRQAQ